MHKPLFTFVMLVILAMALSEKYWVTFSISALASDVSTTNSTFFLLLPANKLFASHKLLKEMMWFSIVEIYLKTVNIWKQPILTNSQQQRWKHELGMIGVERFLQVIELEGLATCKLLQNTGKINCYLIKLSPIVNRDNCLITVHRT